jgi:hypothetical protein
MFVVSPHNGILDGGERIQREIRRGMGGGRRRSKEKGSVFFVSDDRGKKMGRETVVEEISEISTMGDGG